MAMNLSKGLRTALYVLVTLGLLGSWIIALSGVSALQKICHAQGFGGCRRGLGLAWWVIWFEFLAIILTLAVQFSPILSGGKTCVLAYLAILATLQMILADQALNLRDTPNDQLHQEVSGYTDRANTETAGWILLAIFNLAMIAAMSTHPVQDPDNEDYATGGGAGGKHGPPPPSASHPMRPMSSRGGQSLGNSYGNKTTTP